MTTIAGCDHHDQTGLVPDNRSRARMLDQFAAASAFGRAFFQMVLGADLDLSVVTPTGVLRPQPTITIETEKFLTAWTAYMAWREQEPRGDDLLPPFTRGSEIRVPPDEIADPPEGSD